VTGGDEHALGAHRARWLGTVDEAYAEMQRRIDAATRSIRLETYLLRAEGPWPALAAALLRARARGVTVQLLLDALGNEALPQDLLAPLREAGATILLFNRRRFLLRSFRNHSKLLACDGEHAVVGGFNIGPEYAGDGVTHGWCDLGVYVGGPVVAQLEQSFDAMFRLATFTPGALNRFRRRLRSDPPQIPLPDSPVRVLLSGPGARGGLLRRLMGTDLRRARDISIAAAYFLPSSNYRRHLYRAAHRGARVRALLPGRTDVAVARLAAEHLYARLLARRVQLFEYQPQVLHAKLLVADDVVYVGSANLDRRSLHINYELQLRFEWPELAADARRWYEAALASAVQIEPVRWQARRGFGRRVLSYLSWLLLARLDPLLARRGSRSIS
jgi:cardiolipin synthase